MARPVEGRVRPAACEPGRCHRGDSCIYVISGGKARNHTAGGKTAEIVMSAGDVVYRDATTHWAENIGTTEIHLILVELKTPQNSTASRPSE